MPELLLPFDPAASAESPAAPVQPPGAAAAVGALAGSHKVPLSGSCEYTQPARGLLPEVGTRLGQQAEAAPAVPGAGFQSAAVAGCLCGVGGITHAFRHLTEREDEEELCSAMIAGQYSQEVCRA